MSEPGPKSEPGSERDPTPLPNDTPAARVHSRPGFVTMPTELRHFRAQDPTAMTLADMPQAAQAADVLRGMGRGDDVLFEHVRDAAPREPSPDDNRAEHVIVQLPPKPRPASPSSRPPPSVTDTPVHPRSAHGERPRPDRRWMAALVGLSSLALIAVLVVRGMTGPGESDGSGELGATSGHGATTPGTVPTGASMTTGAPPMSTGAAAVTTGAALPTSIPGARLTSTSATPFPPATTGVRPVPKATHDPSVDAGVPPKPAPSVEPSAAPVLSAQPTSAPSAKPSTTVTNPWDVVFEKKKESASQ